MNRVISSFLKGVLIITILLVPVAFPPERTDGDHEPIDDECKHACVHEWERCMKGCTTDACVMMCVRAYRDCCDKCE